MAYNPVTDFIALVRRTSNGMRVAQMPGLDFTLDAMARAGMFLLHVDQTEPTANQATTVWLRPALQSWTAESTVFLWNVSTLSYEPATPALWSSLLSVSLPDHLQDITTAGPVPILEHVDIVRVLNVGAPVTLVLPLSADKIGPTLISNWANGANLITIQTQGGELFPGGVTTWTLAAEAASVFVRPVPGGYAL